MGEQKVSLLTSQRKQQKFTKMLLDDVEALSYMLDNDWFESDITRIGAEQEMVLIDKNTYKPAPVAVEALALMEDLDWVETELARFNLEINLDPLTFEGNCLSVMENEIRTKLTEINKRIESLDSKILLTGILPTLRKHDLESHNLMPMKRYEALMDAIKAQNKGKHHELRLLGIDELIVKHNTPLIEACNTSFQVHLQVAPKNFVNMYNIAQFLTAPCIAIAANSPIVFGRRLWHETRIALFQQSLDTRSTHEHMRERSPRVSFGNQWLDNSILDIYREDIANFRALITSDRTEKSLQMIKEGKTPHLRSLQVHNSTIYRWNRPCYGISPNGKPHLRIENRVFAAGPSVSDEMANTALWLGAMKGYEAHSDDIRKENISFMDVKDNFRKAARYGIDTKFTWIDDKKIGAADLILQEIAPMAREGLKRMNVDSADIDKHIGLIEERAKKHMTGARWMLKTYSNLIEEIPRDEAITTLTACMLKNQSESLPIHKWTFPKPTDLLNYKPSTIKVDEFMTTDVVTVQSDDTLELVGDLMIWKKIKYLPVEDDDGNLIGLITSRQIMSKLLHLRKHNSSKTITVAEIMKKKVVTVDPEASILDALSLLKKNVIGCLPVVRNKELVGILTDSNFLNISTRLIERLESVK